MDDALMGADVGNVKEPVTIVKEDDGRFVAEGEWERFARFGVLDWYAMKNREELDLADNREGVHLTFEIAVGSRDEKRGAIGECDTLPPLLCNAMGELDGGNAT